MRITCCKLFCLTMAASLTAAGCGKTAGERTLRYKLQGTQTVFVVRATQRMPQWAGGEENVTVQRTTELGSSRELKIDHNGRFLKSLRVDSGNGGKWVRLYLELTPAMVGESVPFRTNSQGEVARIFRDFGTGQTVVSNSYRYNVIGFANFEGGSVINGYVANSTIQERNSGLLGLTVNIPVSQNLRGNEVHWERTVLETP